MEPRRISLTTEVEHAEYYAAKRGGSVYEFGVPTRRLMEMEAKGGASRAIDRFEEAGSVGTEWRIHGSFAEELNAYLKRQSTAPSTGE